jgi:hypothetical protein
MRRYKKPATEKSNEESEALREKWETITRACSSSTRQIDSKKFLERWPITCQENEERCAFPDTLLG